jgi:hypothetical protein
VDIRSERRPSDKSFENGLVPVARQFDIDLTQVERSWCRFCAAASAKIR